MQLKDGVLLHLGGICRHIGAPKTEGFSMRFVILASLALAACEEPIPLIDNAPNDCGAQGYQNLIGQSADIFASMTFSAPMRIIKPGMAVTMDYSPTRLNAELDAQNQIVRFYCG